MCTITFLELLLPLSVKAFRSASPAYKFEDKGLTMYLLNLAVTIAANFYFVFTSASTKFFGLTE